MVRTRPRGSPERKPATGSRGRTLLVPAMAATVVAVLVTVGMLWAGGHASRGDSAGSVARVQAPPQRYWSAPYSYTLTDQTGEKVSAQRFRGTVQVVSFLFPYCTTDCPILARDLARLQHALAAKGLDDEVAIVTFNVDPAGAGPKQLSAFLRQYGANADPATAQVPWYYLTGSSKEIRRVVRGGYKVAYWKVKGETDPTQQPNALAKQAEIDYDVKHSDAVYVVDPRGEIRAFFGSTAEVTTGKLLAAIRKAQR